jgi:hypothetical protein
VIYISSLLTHHSSLTHPLIHTHTLWCSSLLTHTLWCSSLITPNFHSLTHSLTHTLTHSLTPLQVANLKSRLADCKPITKQCPDLEEQLVTCLNKGSDPLACRAQLDALVACATNAVVVSD